ncbi:MAG: histidine--tRNA ligase, partial [Clostridia bacterium]
MLTKAPKGTKDVLPNEIYKWHYIETIIRKICDSFGYRELRTPVFEHTELFERGVGDTTDVVQKEMYTFEDKGRRSITLRPEGTASAVRSFLENSLYAAPQPTKMYYLISCYRYEKPQAGRLREFHQFGTEVFGSQKPAADAEVISLAATLLNKLGIKGLELNINSIGCPECRKEYNEILKAYFKQHINKLCTTCNERYERNPLRILDCKVDNCKHIGKDAPVLLDHICDDCRAHFESLKSYLNNMEIQYNIDPYIVRGLDYYTRTVFEFVSKSIGAQGTVCGGGRYDGLIQELGGQQTPGIGFGLGLERLLITMEAQGIDIPQPNPIKLFIANIGEKAEIKAQSLTYSLRQKDISVEKDYMGRSLKAQMKYADKLGAAYTMVLGEDE